MIINTSNFSNIRREYIRGVLRRSNLTKNPMCLFSQWLHEACSAKIPDPTAMCLSTVDKTGQPFQRIVLLKYFIDEQIIFFTNLKSRKSLHLIHNPKISVCFPWHCIDRQVHIIGNAYTLSKKNVIKYFYTRPKDNQISTWVSHQSKMITSRKILENKFLKLKKTYLHKPIPFPYFWGGYTVNIHSIEFWQGGMHRLHDRFVYKKNNGIWNIQRLSP